jgi:predicted ATPase
MPHTHIKRAKLDGYRNIRGTEAEFCDGLNIIIGPNGCGKSNFLWLLANIYSHNEDIVNTRISAEISIFNESINFVNNTMPVLIKHEFNVAENKIAKSIGLTFENKTEQDGSIIFQPYLMFQTFRLIPFALNDNLDCFSNGKTITIQKQIIPNYEKPVLRTYTNNKIVNDLILFNSFNWLEGQINNLDFPKEIIDVLKKYSPIENVRVEFPQREDEIKWYKDEATVSNLMYGFKIHDEWFKWNELSDGSRRIVWIILNVLLAGNETILIEEPELGIHPHQLFELMQFIKEQSKSKQFIITTHSPEVLNIISTDELDRIKIAKYDAAKKTTVIHAIPEKTQIDIQEYAATQGFLSDYWLHLDLENTAEWK